METFTRWVYYFLESLGLDLSYMTNLNRLLVLVLIAVWNITNFHACDTVLSVEFLL